MQIKVANRWLDGFPKFRQTRTLPGEKTPCFVIGRAIRDDNTGWCNVQQYDPLVPESLTEARRKCGEEMEKYLIADSSAGLPADKIRP